MFVNKNLKCAYLKKVKGVIMRNLNNVIFYVKTNVLQDFHICIIVPLNYRQEELNETGIFIHTRDKMTLIYT